MAAIRRISQRSDLTDVATAAHRTRAITDVTVAIKQAEREFHGLCVSTGYRESADVRTGYVEAMLGTIHVMVQGLSRTGKTTATPAEVEDVAVLIARHARESTLSVHQIMNLLQDGVNSLLDQGLTPLLRALRAPSHVRLRGTQEPHYATFYTVGVPTENLEQAERLAARLNLEFESNPSYRYTAYMSDFVVPKASPHADREGRVGVTVSVGGYHVRELDRVVESLNLLRSIRTSRQR